MANYTNVGNAKTATLSAGVVDSVQFTHFVDAMVVNMGTTDYIWVRGGAVDPTVAGDNCLPIPPNCAVQLPYGGNEIRLISAGTPQYTVIGS